MRRKGANIVYYGSEKSIMNAFSKELNKRHCFSIRASDISTKADLAKSSFYIHYRSVPDLIEVNEKKILNSLSEIISSKGFNTMTLETKWRNILLDLYKYREFLDIMIKAKNIELIEMILDMLEESIIICPQNKGILNRDLLYATKHCLILEFRLWQKERFSVDKIPVHAHNLAYMTACAPRFLWTVFR